MIYEFTDTHYAVIMDSLGVTRDKIRAQGRATPNIDEVISAMSGWASPLGCEFTVLTGDDATVLREANAAASANREAQHS